MRWRARRRHLSSCRACSTPDATPEALAHALATGWPSGGVLSAEAGAVFGAAIRLDTWLLNEARATGSPRIPTTRVYQYGPACVTAAT